MEEQQIHGTAHGAEQVAETLVDPNVSEAHHGRHILGIEETVFWLLAAFVLFFVLAGRPVWRGISTMLDKHTAHVRGQLAEAQKLREDAAALLATYQDAQRRALKEAEEIIGHARREAEHIQTRNAQTVAEALARRERQALDKIAQAEAHAIADVRAQAAHLAVAASRDLLKEQLTGAASDKLIGESVQVLSQRLN